MQLFGGMFSTVAWSIATMVLLTLTSTALPTAPTDGLIHPRSDETGTLIRRTNRPGWGDDLEKQKNAATNYMRCLAAWVGVLFGARRVTCSIPFFARAHYRWTIVRQESGLAKLSRHRQPVEKGTAVGRGRECIVHIGRAGVLRAGCQSVWCGAKSKDQSRN